MDGARDQLLPRAVLPGDQHPRAGGGDPIDLRDQGADRWRRADDRPMPFHVGAEARVLLSQGEVADRIPDRDEDPIGVERLLEDVIRTTLRRVDGVAERGVARDHHHHRLGVGGPQPREGLEPIDPRHLHVEEHEARRPTRVGGERLRAARDGPHLVALVFQQLREGGADPGFVIDHQDAVAHPILHAIT